MLSTAHVHAPAYLALLRGMPGVELAGVWDEDPERGRSAARAYGVTAAPSAEALLAGRPDGVVVCSVNRDHRRLTELCASSGAHVLCEKPLATTVEDARAMVQACQVAGVRLMTAFPSRMSAVVRAFVDAVREGAVGELVCLEGVNTGRVPREAPWFIDPELAGGGAVTDHVVHLADVYRWLLASEVEEVYAVANRILPDGLGSVETGGLVSLRFADGVFATIDCSWSKPPSYPTWGGMSIEAVGTGGALEMDAFRQHLDVYGSASPGVEWPYFGSDANAGMLDEFVAAIREEREPAVTGVDGLRAVEIVQAAYRSIATGRPVTLAVVSI
jgi:predicted dehydrogenase